MSSMLMSAAHCAFVSLAVLLLAHPATAVRARSADDEGAPGALSCRERPFTLSRGSFKVKLELTETPIDGTLNVPCGPETGNPGELVTFKCVPGSKRPEAGCYKTVSSGGVLYTDDCSWERVSGSCLDPEELVATCPATVYNVTWKRSGKSTIVSFALPKTRNPEKKVLAVKLPCPANAPNTQASAAFTCKPDGQWVAGGAEDCMRTPINGAAGPLPCQLAAENVPLANGEAGLQLLATCSQGVDNAVLDVPGLEQLYFDNLPAGGSLVLTTQAKLALAGKKAALQGTVTGTVGVVTLQVPGSASSVTSSSSLGPASGKLPCSLEVELVNLQDGSPGFSLVASCSADATGATLKVPGFQDQVFGTLSQGQRYKLLTHSRKTFGGKVLTLQGQSGGQPFTVSVEVPTVGGAEPTTQTTTTPPAGKLPCDLGMDSVQLQSGDPGFTVKVTCAQPVSSAVLKLPGNYQPLSFGDIAAGKTFNLFTHSRKTFGGQTFELSGKVAGAPGVVTAQVPAP